MSSATVARADESYRLPRNVVPTKYDIALVPDLVNWTFEGHLIITLQCKQATETIVLHAADLTFPNDENGQPRITLTSLDDTTAAAIIASSVRLSSEDQTVTIILPLSLTAGATYHVSIHYRGTLNESLAGFYRSSYTRPPLLSSSTLSAVASTSVPLAVTQFEATDARRALPCIDEPAVKAIFAVTIVAPPNVTAVSNMPVLAKITVPANSARGLQHPAGHVMYMYADTPKMSTYLLAFFIGEFDYISSIAANKVEIRVYTPIGKASSGYFALNVATKCLLYYESLFNSPYPLPKMDLLAIPDFAAGAMENWGAISYREIAVLIDNHNSSLAQKQRAARTICHEIAHMWFGNLITMEWWTYLWLNEGFARFTEFTAVHFIFPEWNIWTQFVTDVHAQALVLDAMHSSHPVEVTVSHPDQINEIFDTISYAKGASLIRMLSDAIGAEVYFKGINIYLQRHAYANTRSQDLWAALSEASSIDVGELMDGWLKQVGFPVISVAAQENDPLTLTLTQQPFYADMTDSNTSMDKSKSWVVPISLTTLDANGAPIEFQRLTLKGKSTTIKLSSKFAAVKVNNGHTGFFRTKYDTPALFTALSVSIPYLSSVDRLGLLKDTFALATSGLISISIALDLLKRYTNETDYDVVHAFTADLSMLATLHSDETYYPALQAFIRSLYAANYQRLGWADHTMTAATQADSDPRNGLFRSDVISMMSTAGDESIIKKSMDYVKGAADSPATNSIPADLKAVVYATAAKHGGLDAQQLLLKIYGASSSSEERSRVLSTIGSSSGHSADDELVIKANIDWGINSGEVRLADVPTLMSSVASSKRGRLLVWDYLKANWDAVTGKFSTGQNFLIGSLLTGILSPHTDAAVADDIDQWFAQHPIASADRVVRQSLERIRNKANRLNRERADMSAWLAKNKV